MRRCMIGHSISAAISESLHELQEHSGRTGCRAHDRESARVTSTMRGNSVNCSIRCRSSGLASGYRPCQLDGPARNTTEEILTGTRQVVFGTSISMTTRVGMPICTCPLGAGILDLHGALRALKECGFDGTITLEVFTPDRHFLAYSRDVLRRTWNEIDLEPGALRAGTGCALKRTLNSKTPK